MMNEYSTQEDAKTVNAWLDAHHDEAVDAVSFAVSPVAATVKLLLRQPEFADWDQDRIQDAVMFDEEHNMNETQLYEMPADDVVGWVGDGYALCPEHITDQEAEMKGMQPIFATNENWEDITCDNHRGGIHTLGDTAGISEDMTMGNSTSVLNLEALIVKAVKNGISSAITENKKPKVKKITRKQLAEGVRKALRMALNEAGMIGGSMPAPGMGAGSTMPPTQEEGLSDGDVTKKGTSTYGQVPSPEELEAALEEIGGLDMDLQGADNIAFEYAMIVAGIGNPNMDSGEGMHSVLAALSNAPAPDELPDTVDDEDIEDPNSHLNKILDSWDIRYGRYGENIEDHARSIASSILDVLGWEWI